MLSAKQWEGIIHFFFSRSTYCSPNVLSRILKDLLYVREKFTLSLQLATWGVTKQERLCVYGGLAIESEVLPIQIWLTHLYPLDPPAIFAISPGMGVVPEDGREVEISAAVKTPHPNVDTAGLCYCTALSRWNPQQATLYEVLLCLVDELGKNGFPISYYGPTSRKKVPLSSGNSEIKKWACAVCYIDINMVVLIPCGHSSCCHSCASNLNFCPLCRKKIELRQLILESP